jgi:hypothetical protein
MTKKLLQLLKLRPVEGGYYWWPWVRIMTQYKNGHFFEHKPFSGANNFPIFGWKREAVLLTSGEALEWRLSGVCPALCRPLPHNKFAAAARGAFMAAVEGAVRGSGGWK